MNKQERSKMGKRNRRAGHNFERDVVKYFKAVGYVDAKTSRSESKNRDDQKVDIMNVGVYNPQCKATNKCINYVDVMEEMPEEEVRINIIFSRIKNRGKFCILKVEDMMKIINESELYNET